MYLNTILVSPPIEQSLKIAKFAFVSRHQPIVDRPLQKLFSRVLQSYMGPNLQTTEAKEKHWMRL